MVAILRTTFSNAFPGIEMAKFDYNFIEGPIENKSVLFKVMAWRLSGDRPLSEIMVALFTDA